MVRNFSTYQCEKCSNNNLLRCAFVGISAEVVSKLAIRSE